MIRAKAEKKIRRKVSKALPCPFCGDIPKFDIRCDTKHSGHGSWGHYATRNRCCSATSSGQTELFFCNDFKKPDFGLWKNMVDRLIKTWNTRLALETQS
jgi:hypothetical protein